MKRRILTFGDYFSEFMNTIDSKTQLKINQGLLLLATQERISTKFVKHIKDGLYELRTNWNNNAYRVFFIFDEGNIVVLFNGFHKKTQKTPLNEINKALSIKNQYYASKQTDK